MGTPKNRLIDDIGAVIMSTQNLCLRQKYCIPLYTYKNGVQCEGSKLHRRVSVITVLKCVRLTKECVF